MQLLLIDKEWGGQVGSMRKGGCSGAFRLAGELR